MEEAQIRELVAAVQNIQAQLAASEAARTTLQAQVDRMERASGERKVGVDTRNLGRPSQFNGTDSAWRDWSVVLSQLRGPGASGTEGRDAARGAAADGRKPMRGLLDEEQVQASTDLYHLLLHSTSGPALDRVVNAGSMEGLRAWQLLVERYDPHIRSRTSGQLLSLLQFDSSGDMLAKLEAYERDLGAVRTGLGRDDLRWLAC